MTIIDYINLNNNSFISYKYKFVITDDCLYNIHKDKLHIIFDTSDKTSNNNFNITNYIYQILNGESSKEFEIVEKICNHLSKIKFPRKNSCIIAVGGGVVGDLAGFIASIYMRGVDFIQVPTTLLAMVDSSIGGKNGINNQYGKNLIGTIRQPQKIIIDISFLKTLPENEFINGMAEIIKIAATSNTQLWSLLNKNNLNSIQNNPNLLVNIIKEAAETKINIVKNDEFEQNDDIKCSRMVLNFGHTFGHAIEKLTMEKHGFCVAKGMILETDDFIVKNQLINCMSKYKLPIEISDNYNIDKIVEYIHCDKKGNKMIQLDKIGSPNIFEINDDYVYSKFTKKAIIEKTIMDENNKKFDFIAPGSKSETNRALILASLGNGICTLKNPLVSDDTLHMTHALQSLGIQIIFMNNDIMVKGCGGSIPGKKIPKEIFVGNSGTTMRFLLPLLCTNINNIGIENESIILNGDKWMNNRPIFELVDILNGAGASIDCINEETPPVKIKYSSLFKGGTIVFRKGVSSQYISGIMMVLPFLKNTNNIIIAKDYPSLSFVNLTYKMMLKFGINITMEETEDSFLYTIKNTIYKNPNTLNIEADATACIYPLAFAICHNVDINIKNLFDTNEQGDYQLFKKLIGNNCNDIDMDSSDTFITFAVVFSFINSTFTIKNIENQNLKECKRIDATYKALKKCGVDISLVDNELIISGKEEYPANNNPIYLDCHDDHRLVMSFAILGSKMNNIVLSNYKAVEKTYPNFWKDMETLGLKYKLFDDIIEENENMDNTEINSNSIYLIGMPGVGKTTFGKELAKDIEFEWVDLDHEILKRIDSSIHEYIEIYGWNKFREIEYDVLKKYINKNNCVISTGGGIIENRKSRKLLKKIKYTILLERDIEELQENYIYGITMKELWRRRKKWYYDCSKYSYFNMYSKYLNSEYLQKINLECFINWIDKIINKFVATVDSTFLSLPHIEWNKYIIPEQIYAVEYRYDLYPNDFKRRIFELHHLTDKPIIFTDHSYCGFEMEAQRYGCTIIDLDMTQNIKFKPYTNTFIISSIHNDKYNLIYKTVNNFIHDSKNKTDLIKIVSKNDQYKELDRFVESLSENYKVLKLYRGIEGRLSRLVNKYMTPICLDFDNNKTDPGQISLIELFDIKKILYTDTDRIKKYCLFGKPIDHSISHFIHNRLFNTKNYLGHYTKFETDDAYTAYKYIEDNNIMGASVTIPLKETMLDYMDEISKDVKEIGALNTISRLNNGKLRGDNTDWIAIYDKIMEQKLMDKYILKNSINALVIGTGGTAKSASYAINKLGYNLYIKGRSHEKMNYFKEKFNARIVQSHNYNLVKMTFIIICIPGHVKLDFTENKNCEFVIEMAYNQEMLRTYPKNAKLFYGKDLLTDQAIHQNNIWRKI